MLIIIDGVEGSGNNTILKRLGTILSLEFQQKFITVKDLDCGDDLERSVLRTPNSRVLAAFAALFEDVHHRVIPALRTGASVICGSFISHLYAVHAAVPDTVCSRVLFRTLEREILNMLHRELPDIQVLEIILDVNYETAASRTRQQPGHHVRTRQQFLRQRIAYLERSKRHISQSTMIDTSSLIVPEVLHRIVDEVYRAHVLVPPDLSVSDYSDPDAELIDKSHPSSDLSLSGETS